ncbi:DUF1652 domain-containing protein [Phytopseudomonas dryadis]|nr:DUF1652 domain-containing protein [Pseudomonas dryadis]
MMMSVLEQRRIIETAFLPLNCRCSVCHDDSMVIEISDPLTREVLIKVTGIARSRLASSRDISRFVLQLRHDLRAAKDGSRLA